MSNTLRVKISRNKNMLFLMFITLVIVLRYNIILDLGVITLLLLSAYCLGINFNISGSKFQKIMMQSSLGLGIIGVIIYFILLIGIGSESIYVLILTLPIVFNWKKIKNVVCNEKENIYSYIICNKLFFIVLFILFIFYLVYGSAPIDSYDSLTKHIPITSYAANHGKWYTNVVESIVYGESMVMQYTFSTLFYTLGAYKALVLFNVILFFILFLILLNICLNIYDKTNIWIMLGVYFTVPMFFELATIFYLDILPLYFLFAAIISVVNLNNEQVWKNVKFIAFLSGCSIFSKLTVCYTVFSFGLVVIYLCLSYSINKEKKLKLIKRFFSAFVLFLVPFVTSILYLWYKIGNPSLPFYNGIFKSPYYINDNYIDPFNNSPIYLSIKSLYKIVFYTSNNVEMQNGALGIYLLFSVFVIFALICKRNIKLIVWFTVAIFSYIISCLFTFNLRYFISIFMLLLCVIIISLSMLINYIPYKKRRILYIFTAFVLITPNILFITKYFPIYSKVQVDNRITSNKNISLLDGIPKDKKVFSINDPFKGNFEGYFSAFMWHNTYTLLKIEGGELSWSDYLKSFDYILYEKDTPLIKDENYLIDLIKNSNEQNSLIEWYDENETHILYRVNKNNYLDNISENTFSPPEISRTSKPITVTIDNKWDFYVVTQDIENKNNEPIKMRFQINWHTKDGKFLNTNIITFMADIGRNVYVSDKMLKNKDAAYGVVYITTDNDEEIFVHSYKVEGYGNQNNYINDELQKFYSRILLRKSRSILQ